MSRYYWIQGSTAFPEGRSLDAQTCRELIQGNLEAVFEEARCDYCCILPAREIASAGWYFGPVPVPMRQDRDGSWRSPKIEPLCIGGTSSRTLYGYVTPLYYEPSDAVDPFAEWTVGAGGPPGTPLAWQTAEVASLPKGTFLPYLEQFPDGDEEGRARFAFLTFEWGDISGVTPPSFAGYRYYEQVTDVLS